LPLVKSPTMTPRKMAANRANAKKSTGPQTPEGQRRVMLNGLRHGADSAAFRANLMKAGRNVELFDWIHKRVREEMPLAKPRVAEHLARRVWCGVSLDRSTSQGPKDPPPTQASLWCVAWTPWRAGGLATKPRYTMTSIDPRITYLPPRVKNSDRGPEQPAPADVLGAATPRDKSPASRHCLAGDCRLGDESHAQLHTGEHKRNRLARVGLKAPGTLRPLKE